MRWPTHDERVNRDGVCKITGLCQNYWVFKSSPISQRGNAVILILIGVVLFGALAYTFMRGAKQGQGNMSAQQAKITAQKILDYAQTTERAVTKVMGKGCSETQISFEDATYNAPYMVNGATPSDGSCKIFHANGGGITYQNYATPAYQVSEALGMVSPGHWTSQHQYSPKYYQWPQITGIGKTDGTAASTELVMYVDYLQKPICDVLNALSGISTMPTYVDDGSGRWWVGNFTAPTVWPSDFDNKPAGCFNFTSNRYIFYYVLLGR